MFKKKVHVKHSAVLLEQCLSSKRKCVPWNISRGMGSLICSAQRGLLLWYRTKERCSSTPGSPEPQQTRPWGRDIENMKLNLTFLRNISSHIVNHSTAHNIIEVIMNGKLYDDFVHFGQKVALFFYFFFTITKKKIILKKK